MRPSIRSEKIQTKIYTSSPSKLGMRCVRNSHRPNFQVNVFQQDHYHSKHRAQSAESFSSQCLRSDVAQIHICLDCRRRQQFPEYQILNEEESRVRVFDLQLALCFVATARAVLLSALK